MGLQGKASLGLLLATLALAGCGGGGSDDPPDADNDGVQDSQDAFPNDPAETADSDGDGVGDNADVFPSDASESVDGDGDGVGDNGDNCPSDANAEQLDGDADGSGDTCDALATTFSFPSAFGGDSSVSYTGQTARQMLLTGQVGATSGLTERPGEEVTIAAELQFFITGAGANDTPHGFAVSGGETVIPGPNYGDVSNNKNLNGKIAGGNGVGGGETTRLINDEFFGWEDGLDATPLPIELVNLYIDRLSVEASDGTTPTISTPTDSAVSIGTVQVDAQGRNYRQLLQKFLLGAVNFSQGTNDYFQTDWTNALGQEDTDPFGAGEHNFDEAFGYFGATRNQNDYTDDEAAAKGGRDGFSAGYNDADGDGSIDLRSEFVFGHAQNCAKRDRGAATAANPTDLSKETFDAFLRGREIINNATIAGELTAAASSTLDQQVQIAAQGWEKCISATVIHYINDLTSDLGDYQAPNFADLANFSDATKHWSELKGFALNLQFSPFSPFRDGSVADIDLDDLKTILSNIGDSPVLADGSQDGLPPSGTAQEAIDAYIAGLMAARDTLQAAYGFDAEVVAGW